MNNFLTPLLFLFLLNRYQSNNRKYFLRSNHDIIESSHVQQLLTAAPSSVPSKINLATSTKLSTFSRPSILPTTRHQATQSILPTIFSPATPTFTYFAASGNQIIGKDGTAVRITAVNWSNYECFYVLFVNHQ